MPIRRLIEKVANGEVRIPAFQRDFVWGPDRVAQFIDTIYKGYPFGSLLFWRASEQLEHERMLGPYELPDLAPGYPLDYVLDGQQRVTSIFASFQTELERPPESDWTDIYFDFLAEQDPQDSMFFPLAASEADPERYFPVKVLFSSVEYRQATEAVPKEYLTRIDDLQSRIKETLVPVQVLQTEDRATVAIVFERINHQGVPLDTLQLLTAWTWNEDFDLQQRFEDLRESLDEHGFAGVGEDTSLVLRCCAAIIAGSSRADALISLNGSVVRDRFDEVENGIKGAVDFLRKQLGVETLRNLPYPALLIPLSVFFAVGGTTMLLPTADQLAALTRWFWRSCFSERYSGQTVRVTENDTEEIRKLREGEENSLGEFAVTVGPEFFLNNEFRMSAAKTATFVLLLATQKPRSFISGSYVKLEEALQAYNRHEFHHMYPQALLRDDGIPNSEINCLANICFLSRADNNKIRRRRPSEYRALMPADPTLSKILKSAVTTEVLFNDDFEAFRVERAEMLAALAKELIA